MSIKLSVHSYPYDYKLLRCPLGIIPHQIRKYIFGTSEWYVYSR